MDTQKDYGIDYLEPEEELELRSKIAECEDRLDSHDCSLFLKGHCDCSEEYRILFEYEKELRSRT